MTREIPFRGFHAFYHIMDETGCINLDIHSPNVVAPFRKLRGIRPNIDLNLNSFCSAGICDTFGMPRIWGLDLTYVLDGKSITLNDRTYVIDLAGST
ncbi:hypothetical protein MKX08_007953 [Trichoderma sp. CBMAI-0020]|nr:hypothetical protein MKX08_007953 [Trichoderma sp. CBMAI-0020]